MSTSAAFRRLDYALVDVFAERPLEGNMLAIFPDAHGLSDGEMQALARETNLAETTFILPSDDPAAEQENGVRVRIFTTEEELPFAGHPTLGTASWLFFNHPALRGGESLTLALAGGPVTVGFRKPEPGELGVFATMQQQDPVFGNLHAAEEVSRATGIPLEDLHATLPIQTVSTGLPFCIVPVKSIAALAALAIPQAAARSYLASSDAKFFYVIAPTGLTDAAPFRARMQFYNGEDPATGSASGCAISYLVRHGFAPSGRQTILEQGIEIGRPSKIYAEASLTDGKIGGVFVGGRTVPVASGVFSLPYR